MSSALVKSPKGFRWIKGLLLALELLIIIPHWKHIKVSDCILPICYTTSGTDVNYTSSRTVMDSYRTVMDSSRTVMDSSRTVMDLS